MRSLATFLAALATNNESLQLRPFVVCQGNLVKLSANCRQAIISSYLSRRSKIELTAMIANTARITYCLLACCLLLGSLCHDETKVDHNRTRRFQ